MLHIITGHIDCFTDVKCTDKIIKGIGLMKRIFVMVCIIMFLGIFLIPGRAVASNDEDLQKLMTTHQCSKCDLSGASLKGANLSEATISDANLKKSDLTEADMSEAKQTEANLSGANLNEVKLYGAKLSDAKWTDGSKCKEGSVGQCIN
jgi:hypothetical protein